MPLKKEGMHWYLTDEEVQFVRKQLEELRTHMNYVPGKWCLSGLNCKPEVMSLSLLPQMPKKVLLRDISLRTATQVNGVSLTREERCGIFNFSPVPSRSNVIKLGIEKLNHLTGWLSFFSL